VVPRAVLDAVVKRKIPSPRRDNGQVGTETSCESQISYLLSVRGTGRIRGALQGSEGL
jgi:hypothetical protein